MNVWTFWTWTSILVLTIGSFVVFVWFLSDLISIRRDILEEERSERLGHSGGGTRGMG